MRRLRESGLDAPPAPRVLGVDAWGWRKAAHSGTIVCDLERGRGIDLLPDRKGDTLAAWRKDPRSVELVVRDRADADGARPGAPLGGLCCATAVPALHSVLDHHHRHLDQAAQMACASVTGEPAANDPAPEADSARQAEPPVTQAERRSLAARQRREARFEEAVRLREQGMTLQGVAPTLGLSRKTVRRGRRAGHAPTWRHADRGRSSLAPFHASREARWAAGCRHGTGVWRELRKRGFTGQAGVVRQSAARRRRQDPTADRPGAAKPPKVQPPTARLLISERAKLGEEDRRFVTALLELSPPVARAVELAKAFSTMIPRGLANQLDDWIGAAEGGGVTGFARSLRQDRDGVSAALTMPWSTGPVEGPINRLKVIK